MGICAAFIVIDWLGRTHPLPRGGSDPVQATPMGTHFTALVNHNLDERDIYNLPDLLNSTWANVEQFLPVVEGYPAPGIVLSKWEWSKRDGAFSIEKLRANEIAMLVGTEFGGEASKHVFSLTHVAKWSWFLEDQQVRSKLRNVSRHIASVLGSDKTVYVPCGFLKPEGVRSLVYEGKDVEEMIDWLYENCGQPAQSFESIQSEDITNFYYIDRTSQPDLGG